MSATTIVSAGTVTAPTGSAMQHHEIFDGTNFWHFYIESATAGSLKCKYSSDRVTWTAGASLTLSFNHSGDGREFSLCFKNIGGTLVIYLAMALTASASRRAAFYCRGTISGTTLTWGTMGDVDSGHGGTDTNVNPAAIDVVIDANNKAHIWTSTANGSGNGVSYLASNADTGSAWTAGFAASKSEYSPAAYLHSGCIFDIGSGNAFAISDNATTTGTTCYTNSESSKFGGTTWAAAAAVFASALGAAVDADNWGAALVSGSDVHCVQRSGSNTFIHRRWNGTSWGAGSSITNQTSKAGTGCAMGYDGTNVYLAIIDSGAANSVLYCTWTSAGGWTAWTTLESSTQVRSNIGIICTASGTGVYWSEVNGSNKDIVTASVGISGGGGTTVRGPGILNGGGMGRATKSPGIMTGGQLRRAA